MLVSMARIGLSAMPVENSVTSCTILFLILFVSVRNIRRVTLKLEPVAENKQQAGNHRW